MALLVLLCMLVLGGCTPKEEPLPPVPPAPEDLSTWAVPELVQPPPPDVAPPPAPKESKPTAAELVLEYAPGETYTVPVAMGTPLAIVLQPGEQVRNIMSGDQPPVETSPTGEIAPSGDAKPSGPWKMREGAEGIGETLRHHVFLTATHPGLTMGLVITTTQRAYYMTCKSVKTSPVRLVRWRYPVEVTALPPPPKEPGLLPEPMQPKLYHVGYEILGNKPTWQPRQVVDDGRKTYILFPEVSLFETMPMIRLIGPNGPQLVNARQYLNVVILDQLLPRAELRMGIGAGAQVVTITQGAAMRTISCPESPECPVWPAAASVVVRRSPPVQPSSAGGQ